MREGKNNSLAFKTWDSRNYSFAPKRFQIELINRMVDRDRVVQKTIDATSASKLIENHAGTRYITSQK